MYYIDFYRQISIIEESTGKRKNNHVILGRKRIAYELASRANASTRPECGTGYT